MYLYYLTYEYNTLYKIILLFSYANTIYIYIWFSIVTIIVIVFLILTQFIGTEVIFIRWFNGKYIEIKKESNDDERSSEISDYKEENKTFQSSNLTINLMKQGFQIFLKEINLFTINIFL